MPTKIIAHRGASAYKPENTIPAFALAIEQGAEGLELDVHLSKDGEVVVAHDLTLERVSNGIGRICDYNLAELKKLDFSKVFSMHSHGVQTPSSSHQPIIGNPSFDYEPCTLPTLAEVYALVAGSQVSNAPLTINVELKTTQELYPAMPEKLIKLEKEYAMEGRITYSSFNHYSLMAIKQYNKSAQIGILYDLGMVDPWVYAEYLQATAIHPHYSIIAALPETVHECHKRGIEVNVWTVDDPAAIKYMLSLGVDNLMTNKPDTALQIRQQTQ